MRLRSLARDQAPGIVLFFATAAAIVWANSPWSSSYEALWKRSFDVGFGTHVLSEPLLLWINDGLMAVFFFVVGIEIKSEILTGRLSSIRKATLPLVAAAGGMIVPALVYLLFNAGSPRSVGWGIPMATDIAFALGVLVVLGKRVPAGLKAFLVALAIADDVGAVLVIALFYGSDLHTTHVFIAFGYVAALILANRLGVVHPLPYALVGVLGVWHCFLLSGIHPTIAGILLAFTIPSRSGSDDGESPAESIRSALAPAVTFIVLPLFALANAGVTLPDDAGVLLDDRVALGILAGLVLGKQLGIFLSARMAISMGLASLPEDVSFRQLYGASLLGGIGFTISLFIASLSFYGTEHLAVAKTAILLASLLAGFAGWLVLRVPSPIVRGT